MASLITEAAASSSSSSLPAASSTDLPNHHRYDVFLSFRGEDTRTNFTDHLHSALCEKGIEAFIDDELRRGEEISAALVKAIEESRVSIIIFSHNYASSRWCLDELVKILECRKSRGQEVRSVFYKVDPSDVRHQRGAFGDAFAKLDQRKYKDSMDKWKAALTEAAYLSGWPFKDGEYEAKFIKMIVGELSARVVNPSCELQVATHPIGLESRTEYVKKLLDLNKKNSVGMVGIWGPGGIGKTTIAKAVFNSMHLKFEGSCFLADVRSNSNDLARMQETLLSIVKDSTLKVSGVNQGVSFIKTRMRHKKVLIILDDVSHSSQLEKLVPSPDCFGPGSRILITTRDKRVLTAHRVDEVHEVKMLDDSQALNLFSLNAFETNKPPSDYVKLAQRAVGYAQGLPLALIVLGRHLFRRSKEEWEATLDSCRGEDPHRQIRDVLKISYDALGADLKGYFLDVACFFKGKLVDDVKPILDACYDLKSVIGIAQLQEKALIRINEVWLGRTKRDVIWMHDLIEEMGKDIVYQESPDEPGDRTRVWSRDDAEHVLTNNTGTNKVVGIQGHPRNRIPLNPKSFLEMKMLRYVSMTWTSYDYSEEFNYLSNQLRWLDWPYIPFRNFPSNFPANKLVQFNIPYSRRITRLWERRQNLSSLTRMDLRGCIFLRELPDFGGTPNLNELDLSECSGLVKVPDSLCLLDKLVTLKADRCYSLVKFPRKINLKSIETISISYCKLEEFSEVGEEMVSLRSLDLSWCENLKTLPCSIYGLQNLEVLILDECSKLVRFPPSNTNILNNDGLSPSLPKLRSFSIKGCSLSDCDFLMTLDCWETLEALYLSRNNFVSLPACLSKCVKLRYLELNGCKRLRGIPELPPNVRPEIEGCESLDSGLRLKAEEPSTVIPSKRQRCRDQ